MTWSISPSVGAITSTGLYTAPAAIASAQTVTVTATSVADPTRSASASISLVSTSGAQTLLQIHADASELSGLTKGSTVTPSSGPAGFTGSVVVNGTGSVNFTPPESGNGVFFLNCCDNANNAYYKFTGASLGNIFGVNQEQISFYLTSRYSFAQRQTTQTQARYAFDVRDNDANNHLFYFMTQPTSAYLLFSYRVGGAVQFYFVPTGTEDTLFGSGVSLKVTIMWDGSVSKLYLNDTLVQSSSDAKATPNWTTASTFDLGAYEYLTFGGYNSSDDVIDEFTVSTSSTPASLSSLQCAAATLAANFSTTCTVTLSKAAPSGGATVALVSNTPALAVPASVIVPAAANSATFSASTGAFTTDQSGVVTASLNGSSSTVALTLVAPVTLSSLQCAATLAANSSTTCTVTLSKATLSGAASVLVSTNNAALTVPSVITFPAGSLSANFAVSVGVFTTAQTAVITATLGSVSRSATIALSNSPNVTQTLLQIHADASELSGLTKGSTVTPSSGPAGFTGSVVVNGTGSVNFTPPESGNGVFFLNCCDNTNNGHTISLQALHWGTFLASTRNRFRFI